MTSGRSRLIRWIAVGIVAALAATGCGSEAEGATSDLEKLRVSVLPALSFAPYYLAEANGHFEDEALEIEFVPSQRGIDTLPLLLQGDLDVWNGAINAGILNAAAAGESVRIVADKGSLTAGKCGYVGLMGAPEILDPTGRVDAQKLPGIRIATGTGMTTGYATSSFLAEHGLDDSSVRFESMGMSDRAAALQAGQVQLASIAEPSITRLKREGLVVVADGAESTPDLTLAVVGFGRNLLEDRPELGDRFMRAYLRGVADYNAGPTPENLAILSEATEVEEEILRDACWPSINPDGSIDTTVLAAAQEWALADGQLEQIVDADDYYDPGVATAAYAAING